MDTTIKGRIENIRGPYNNGWCIISVSGGRTLTGILPGRFEVGDFCEFQQIKEKKHPKFGSQYTYQGINLILPRDTEMIKDYLRNKFKGVGRKTASMLIETFGSELFDIIEKEPDRLSECHGISRKKNESIISQYQDFKHRQSFDRFYATHGISDAMLQRCLNKYKTEKEVVEIIQTNPYKLADEINGIGFLKADKIGMSLGFDRANPFRLQAALFYFLNEQAKSGNICFPLNRTISELAKMLAIDIKFCESAVSNALGKNKLVRDGKNLYIPALHRAENNVAQRIRDALQTPSIGNFYFADLTHDDLDSLDIYQREALNLITEKRFCIITGGPGFGKTFLITTIIAGFANKRVLLAAPTGKAAKRMTEVTKRDARTIHRLLEYTQKGFKRNFRNPIDADCLIIDEVSMIDICLMDALLDAIDFRKTQVIMVGDKDQLPSVGAGRVLNDMIDSGCVPVAILKKLHRRDEKSFITYNADRLIRSGDFKKGSGQGNLKIGNDFRFVAEEDSERIPERIMEMCGVLEGEGYDLSDIQILCPQKTRNIGTIALNSFLRDTVFNPDGEKIRKTDFRLGDKIIQLHNDYDLGIFNGDIGFISDANYEGDLRIEFEGTEKLVVEYPKSKIKHIALAYALTIHKFQGSESPVIIIPVHFANYFMLKKNLLYTGITRGKEMVVLIGQAKAINKARITPDSAVRYSGLADKLVWQEEG